MKKNDDWEKVENLPSWDFEENKELVGKFLGVEEGVGPNNSMLYTFDTDEGKVSVWGSTVLDIRLKNVEIGEEVKIVYLGKEKSEQRKGATYKNFEVYHRKEKLNEDVDPNDIPL